MTNSNIPQLMKAVVISGEQAVLKTDVPVPELKEDYMLVKVIAVAGNPTDWKHYVYKFGPQGAIVGCDVAGQVVKLGANVDESEFAVGEYVYGFLHGSSPHMPENGGFAEYAALDKNLTFHAPKDVKLSGLDWIPEGKISSFESIVSLPLSLETVGGILHHDFDLKLEIDPPKPQKNSPILIWGGATAIGLLSIQIAKKLNGFTKIIAVASKKHEKLLKQYGADEVFDYHNKDIIEQIKSKYSNIQYLLDGVSTAETLNQIYQCAADNLPANVLNLNLFDIEVIEKQYRKENVGMLSTLIYNAGGYQFELLGQVFPAMPVYRQKVSDFNKFIQKLLDDGTIHHIPVKVYKTGLEGVPQMIEDVRAGKNSGEKLVAIL